MFRSDHIQFPDFSDNLLLPDHEYRRAISPVAGFKLSAAPLPPERLALETIAEPIPLSGGAIANPHKRQQGCRADCGQKDGYDFAFALKTTFVIRWD
jgi:hypothetical protein